MKTIQNKTTTIETGNKNGVGGIEFISYSSLIKTIMQRPKQEGYSIEEMRKNFRVLDALNTTNGEINLEDADFDHFKSEMKKMRWSSPHKDLIQFEDDINAIK